MSLMQCRCKAFGLLLPRWIIEILENGDTLAALTDFMVLTDYYLLMSVMGFSFYDVYVPWLYDYFTKQMIDFPTRTVNLAHI